MTTTAASLFVPPTATLRSATPSDSPRLAELVALASHGISEYIWQNLAQPGEDLMTVGTARLARTEANLSYRNAQVIAVEGDAKAMMLGYRLEVEEVDWSEVPALLCPLIELEQKVTGSFYINVLATLPQYSRMGFASTLLNAGRQIAQNLKCKTLSLIVFEENVEALTLYTKHGFQVTDQRSVISHPCCPFRGKVLLMTCPV